MSDDLLGIPIPVFTKVRIRDSKEVILVSLLLLFISKGRVGLIKEGVVVLHLLFIISKGRVGETKEVLMDLLVDVGAYKGVVWIYKGDVVEIFEVEKHFYFGLGSIWLSG